LTAEYRVSQAPSFSQSHRTRRLAAGVVGWVEQLASTLNVVRVLPNVGVTEKQAEGDVAVALGRMEKRHSKTDVATILETFFMQIPPKLPNNFLGA
jgi:hypothetical protein